MVKISTNENFKNYEIAENHTSPGFGINLNCGSENIIIGVIIIFTIEEVNNYAPEFSSGSYNIKIPTPLPRDFDVTYFMNDPKIFAIDNDLYNNSITFEIFETNLFRVEMDVDNTALKPIHHAKIISTQSILQIDDELNFILKASVRFKFIEKLMKKYFFFHFLGLV